MGEGVVNGGGAWLVGRGGGYIPKCGQMHT